MEQTKPQLEEKATGQEDHQTLNRPLPRMPQQQWNQNRFEPQLQTHWPRPRRSDNWYGPQSHTDKQGDGPQPWGKEINKSWPLPWKTEHNWPLPWSYNSDKHVWWESWPQPYEETVPQWDKGHNKSSAAAGHWPWPKQSTASASTETTPADLLESKQQDQYWSDVSFLEKNEEKDRRRRQAYRANLRERRWEAAERVAMVEEDVNATRTLKKRKLSSQVMEIARKQEAAEVTTLSDTLPGTPVELKRHQQTSDDEKPPTADRPEPLETHLDEVNSKKRKADATGDQQTLHLTPWIVQQYQLNQPTDVNIPQDQIERKNAKYRWASYSRIAPQLHSHTKNRSQVVAPPVGIQLIEAFRTWQALQIPRK